MTSQTLGGTRLYPVANRLDRETALRLWTEANTWFSNEEGKKGQIKIGQLADLAVLSDDYFTVPEAEIVHLRSVLTVLGGKVVHGEGDYGPLAPALPAPMPDWSPVATFGGYYRTPETQAKLAIELRLFAWLRRAWSRPCRGARRECPRCGRPQLLGRLWLRLLGGVAPSATSRPR